MNPDSIDMVSCHTENNFDYSLKTKKRNPEVVKSTPPVEKRPSATLNHDNMYTIFNFMRFYLNWK